MDNDRRSIHHQLWQLTIGLWAAHFVSMVLRSAVVGAYDDFGSTFARLIAALCGIAITMSLYAIVERRAARAALDRFFFAALLALPACALLTLINETAFAVFSPAYAVDRSLYLDRAELSLTFVFFYWVFIAWCALYASIVSAVELRQRDRRLAAAEHAANAAQLSALRLQIQPHFLFNTLNTLSGLVSLNRRADAEDMILNLSTFLRRTLALPAEQLVTLAQELESQRSYLAIERTRFEDRLQVDFQIAEICFSALTPSLILQPLVENAIRHGLSPSSSAVIITIGAEKAGDVLHLWVSNVGAEPGIPTPGFGIGLTNVRERLHVHFGDRASLTAAPLANGWKSSIEHPWLTEDTCAS